MHTSSLLFIQDLAIIMLIAGLTTIICFRLKQPIVFGYIIAGIIIGPHTPPYMFISDENTVKTLAELGVIFLMFSLGLEFNLHKLSKVGFPALIAAILEIIFMIGLGYGIGRLFGWYKIDSIFLGAILSISSTTIIIKALHELKIKNEEFAQLIFGILIVEDIFAILILALLSSIAITGSLQMNEVIITATKLFSFLVISLLLGILLITRLISYVARFHNNEMLLITVLGLCFGFCLLVVKLEYSVALGAFIIGAIIAESRKHHLIERLINPIRDMFSAIFFVSVGLLFDFNVLQHYFIPIIVITLAVIIGKVLSSSFGVFITGRDGKTAIRVGMGLAQIGEFSFIIAGLGITMHVTSDFLYSIAVGVSIITILTTPYLIKYSDAFSQSLSQFIPKRITNLFSVYIALIQSIQFSDEQEHVKSAIKRSIYQIIINLFVVIAIFLSSSYIATSHAGAFLIQLTNLYIQKTIIWAVALILSLPFLIASFIKLKALSLIFAELTFKKTFDEKHHFNAHNIISEILPIIFYIAIMILIALLSASILPPLELLFIIIIFALILIIYLLPWFVKFHSKLQISLLNSLKKQTKKKKD